jgi:hypothetical protein
MTKPLMIQSDLLLASQLDKAGIPVHEEILERMRAACNRTDRRRLMISQCGGVTDSRAFVIPGHGTGFIVHTKMVNDRGGKIALCEATLELPWADRFFAWLPDPSEIHESQCYRFPGVSYLSYPRKEVINHEIFGRRRLQYSDFVEGALLGFGAEKIPDCFPHGFPLEGKLVVEDQLDIRHESEITLYIDRSAELTRKKHEPNRRWGRLFDECDDLVKASGARAEGTSRELVSSEA